MAKQRVTPILRQEIEKMKVELSQPSTPLPTPDEVTKAVSQATNLPLPEPVATLVAPESEARTGRPIKENAIGRVKFTTALRPDVVKWLKTYAIANDQTAADILETALVKFKDEIDPS